VSEDQFKVLLDTQERKRFEKVLKKIKDFPIKIVPLRAGDLLISGEKGNVLIERKSMGDFAGSISSGQLFKEMEQMYAETRNVLPEGSRIDLFLLIEGSLLDIVKRRDWQINSLLSGMVMVPLSWHMNLIWIQDKDMTPLIIYAISSYLGKPKEPPRIYGSRPKRKLRSIREQQRFLVEGFAGIGGETSDQLLKNSGSPYDLFHNIQQGIKVKGLGPTRLELLKKVLFTHYEDKKEVRD